MPYSYYDYIINWYEDYYQTYYEINDVYNYYDGSITNITLCNQNGTNSSFDPTNCEPQSHDYTYPIWWYQDIDSLVPLILCMTILCAVVSIAIAILYFHQLRKALISNRPPNKCLIIVASCCIIAHTVYNTAQIVVYYFFFVNFEWYRWLSTQIGWIVCWGFAKIFLYSLFAFKYFELAHTPIYKAPSKTSKRVTLACIILGLLAQIILTILFNIYYFEYQDLEWFAENEEEKRRQVLNANLVIMAVDVFLICFVGLLIFRSVSQLMTVIHAERTNPINVDHEHSASQQEMIERTTRTALTCIVSLCSTIVIQIVWVISQATDNRDLYYVTYLWSLDNVINMMCVYFSMDFAKKHYQKICGDICKCHKCFLYCIMSVAGTKAKEKESSSSAKPKGSTSIALAGLDTTVDQHVDQI